MEQQTKLIAERLRWARINADVSPETLASACGVTVEEYLELEKGEKDFYFNFLYNCALTLQMDLSELVSGTDPKLGFFTLTRAGGGMPIRKGDGFHYRHVAPFLKNRLSEPFVVTAVYDSAKESAPIELATHPGQEFDMVLEGQLKIQLDDHIFILNEGDSIFYESEHAHGMVALGGKDCKFLAIVHKEEGTPENQPVLQETPFLPPVVDSFSDPVAYNKRYENCVYKRFVTEEIDENGRLKSIDFNPPENFNFAYDVMDALAEKSPNKRALVWVDDDLTRRDFTYKELQDEVNRTANYFASLGIAKGDRVMLVLKRHYQFWFSILALHKLGAVAIPATNQLVEKDFVYRFDAAGVTAICCTADGKVAEEAEKAAAKCDTLKTLIMVNGSREGWHDYDTEVRRFSKRFDRVETKLEEPMIMLFTSGTTGYPRIATHDHGYALGHLITARWWHCVDPEGLHFTASDTGWGKALWGKLYGCWFCECAVFVYNYERFDPEKMLPLFAQCGVTTFCAPPTIYRFLIKCDLSKYDLSTIRYACTAGEALNPEVWNKFLEATGLKIMEAFGQTETTLTIGNLYGETPRPGSMGVPSPAYDVDVVREDGTPCSVGEVGEICVRIPQGQKPYGLFMGYYRDEEKTSAAMRGGMYHTGDTAWKDEDGFYWYVGRTDDLIKSSGYRIGPFEIESVLMELPYVLECAITGVPDPVRGQVVKATIVLTQGTEGSEALVKEIQTYVKTHTAPYKYPRVVEFVKELPKTISGKIRRVELKGK